MNKTFLFFSIVLMLIFPETLVAQSEKIEKSLKLAGAELKFSGELNIYGHKLWPKHASGFTPEDPDDKAYALQDSLGFTQQHVELSDSPDGRWTVITLYVDQKGHDYWLYDHETKAKPVYFEVELGNRFSSVHWHGSRLFRVQKDCSMLCSSNQFFDPKDLKHPSLPIGDFITYNPEKNLYVSVYGDGLEVGRPTGNKKPQRLCIGKGFDYNYMGSQQDENNVKDRELTTVFKGGNMIVDYQTEGGKRVHKEFLLKF